jgi:hypothetical protein
MEEFGKKIDNATPKLNAVHVTIPDNIKKWFKHNWSRQKREVESQWKIIDSLEDGAEKLSAYVLLAVMFNIVVGNMVGTQPDAVETDFTVNGNAEKEDSSIDSAPDSNILGFTFTL